MRTTIAAVFENGVFKPEQPVPLEEKARVRLVVESSSSSQPRDANWDAIDELIGFIEDGPEAPVGRDHDKVLYAR